MVGLHTRRRSWRRPGMYRCACGLRVEHIGGVAVVRPSWRAVQHAAATSGAANEFTGWRIPDGDVVQVGGYPSVKQRLARNRGRHW